MDDQMTGVRIHWPVDHDYTYQSSTFSAFFKTVIPLLRNLWWMVDEQTFRPPDELPDNDLAAFSARMHWVAAEGDDPRGWCVDPHYACDKGFLTDYTEWVNHDWCWMYGFEQPLADWRGWLRNGHKTGPQWQAERAKYLATTTEVCFFGLAFVYWEFFARDAKLIRVASESASAAGLVAMPAVLAECVGL